MGVESVAADVVVAVGDAFGGDPRAVEGRFASLCPHKLVGAGGLSQPPQALEEAALARTDHRVQIFGSRTCEWLSKKMFLSPFMTDFVTEKLLS